MVNKGYTTLGRFIYISQFESVKYNRIKQKKDLQLAPHDPKKIRAGYAPALMSVNTLGLTYLSNWSTS
jgi:hypothetical protein